MNQIYQYVGFMGSPTIPTSSKCNSASKLMSAGRLPSDGGMEDKPKPKSSSLLFVLVRSPEQWQHNHKKLFPSKCNQVQHASTDATARMRDFAHNLHAG